MIHDTDPGRGLSQLAAARAVRAARARSDTADPDNGRLTGLITAAPTLKVAAGEFQRAADLYDQMEAQPDAAFARLQVARRLVVL